MIQLIKYEWKKAFLKKTIVILMVIFIIIDLIKIVDIYNKKSYLISAGTVWREAYWDMYKDYNGNITDDKIQSLDDMYQKLGEEVIEMTASREMDLEKYMTGTVYSDYNFLDRYYITPFRYLPYIKTEPEKSARGQQTLPLMPKIRETWKSTGRNGTGVVVENSVLEIGYFKNPKHNPSDRLPPARLHLQKFRNLLEQSHQLGTRC